MMATMAIMVSCKICLTIFTLACYSVTCRVVQYWASSAVAYGLYTAAITSSPVRGSELRASTWITSCVSGDSAELQHVNLEGCCVCVYYLHVRYTNGNWFDGAPPIDRCPRRQLFQRFDAMFFSVTEGERHSSTFEDLDT